MHPRFFSIVISFCILFASGLQASIQETLPLKEDIRGLYSPFLDQYKHLSPVHGWVVLVNVLPNVRFQGRYGPQKPECFCHRQITNPGDNHQPTSATDCPQDHTSALVQHFFPSPTGGFLRTPEPGKFDFIARLTPQKIAELLKIYTQYSEKVSKAQKEDIEAIKKEFFDQFQSFFQTHLENIEKDGQGYGKLQEMWKHLDLHLKTETLPPLYAKMFTEALNKLIEKAPKEDPRVEIMLPLNAKMFTEALDELIKKDPKKDPRVKILPLLYAKMFTEALNEQDHYPKHLVEYTLLAFLWKKIDKKSDFVNFIDVLLSNPSTTSNPSTKLSAEEKKKLRKEQRKLSAEEKKKLREEQRKLGEEKKKLREEQRKLGANKLPAFSKDLYWEERNKSLLNDKLIPEAFDRWIQDPELLVFMTMGYDLFENPYPKMFDYRTAVYTSPSQGKISFSDCGETSVRNFLHFMLASPSRRAFDVSILQQAFPNAKKELIEFYKQYSSYSSVVESPQYRNAWADAISGLDPSKVSYRERVCNIVGEGIGNILAVLEEILGDEDLKKITGENPEKTYAQKFQYIMDQFNRERSKIWVEWSENGQSETLSKYPVITFSVKNIPVFDWTFMRGHFTFLPIQDRKNNKNWLFNSPTGFEKLLNSEDLSDDLRRALLPFYEGGLKNLANKEKLKPYVYEFLFGRSFGGNQQLLEALRPFLTMDLLDDSQKTLASSWISKAFSVADPVGDGILSQFLTEHGKNFGLPACERIIDGFKSNPKRTLDFFQYNPSPPYSETLLIGVIKRLSKEYLLEYKIHSGGTLLHLASSKGYLEVLKMFLGDKEIRETLLKPENIKDNDGRTPLYTNDPNALKILLNDPEAKKILIDPQNIKGNNGRTPLYTNDPDVVKILLDDPEAKKILLDPQNIKDNDGETPLYTNDPDVVKILLDDPEAKKILLDPQNIKSYYGRTPLHTNNPNILKILLDDPEAKKILLDPQNIKNKFGKTPLHLALLESCVYCVKNLLDDQEARSILLSSENLKDKNGKTPLDLARSQEMKDLLKGYGIGN